MITIWLFNAGSSEEYYNTIHFFCPSPLTPCLLNLMHELHDLKKTKKTTKPDVYNETLVPCTDNPPLGSMHAPKDIRLTHPHWPHSLTRPQVVSHRHNGHFLRVWVTKTIKMWLIAKKGSFTVMLQLIINNKKNFLTHFIVDLAMKEHKKARFGDL